MFSCGSLRAFLLFFFVGVNVEAFKIFAKVAFKHAVRLEELLGVGRQIVVLLFDRRFCNFDVVCLAVGNPFAFGVDRLEGLAPQLLLGITVRRRRLTGARVSRQRLLNHLIVVFAVSHALAFDRTDRGLQECIWIFRKLLVVFGDSLLRVGRGYGVVFHKCRKRFVSRQIGFKDTAVFFSRLLLDRLISLLSRLALGVFVNLLLVFLCFSRKDFSLYQLIVGVLLQRFEVRPCGHRLAVDRIGQRDVSHRVVKFRFFDFLPVNLGNDLCPVSDAVDVHQRAPRRPDADHPDTEDQGRCLQPFLSHYSFFQNVLL